MAHFCISHARIIVNQSKMLSMLLPFSILANKKGNRSIGQSILFAGAGSHRPGSLF